MQDGPDLAPLVLRLHTGAWQCSSLGCVSVFCRLCVLQCLLVYLAGGVLVPVCYTVAVACCGRCVACCVKKDLDGSVCVHGRNANRRCGLNACYMTKVA